MFFEKDVHVFGIAPEPFRNLKLSLFYESYKLYVFSKNDVEGSCVEELERK